MSVEILPETHKNKKKLLQKFENDVVEFSK